MNLVVARKKMFGAKCCPRPAGRLREALTGNQCAARQVLPAGRGRTTYRPLFLECIEMGKQ